MKIELSCVNTLERDVEMLFERAVFRNTATVFGKLFPLVKQEMEYITEKCHISKML